MSRRISDAGRGIVGYRGSVHVYRADEPLPVSPRRVCAGGASGSGKSTVARRMGEILGVPYTELDSLFHGPGWTIRETWIDEVSDFTSGPEWSIEWQGKEVRPLIAERAELLVWLDLPRWLVIRQVVRRTLVRRFRREELWAGNKEAPLWKIFTDKEHIVRWAWQTHAHVKEFMQPVADGQYPHLIVVRLRSRRDVERWLRGPLREAAARRAAAG